MTEKNLRTYRQRFRQHQTAVRDYCRNYRLGCTQSPSTVAFDHLILRRMRGAG